MIPTNEGKRLTNERTKFQANHQSIEPSKLAPTWLVQHHYYRTGKHGITKSTVVAIMWTEVTERAPTPARIFSTLNNCLPDALVRNICLYSTMQNHFALDLTDIVGVCAT